MIGIGGAIKAIVYLVIVVVIAGGLWYVMNIKADLATSEANNQKLQDAIQVQKELIEQMQKDVEQIQETNKQLAEQNEKQRQDVATLSSKFSKRDFGALAAEKPAVVEKLVNRGTANVMRCLELASGAPLNEKEKAAKTPTEANRECPSLIDNDYKAPM
jgi:predicted phage gp36 major capsid-like protein